MTRFAGLFTSYVAEPPVGVDAYPDHPGAKERGGCSEEAAVAMAGAARCLRQRALACLSAHAGGLTADQTAAALGTTELAMRPRFSELKEAGEIEKTSERRPNRSGRQATVWRVATARKSAP